MSDLRNVIVGTSRVLQDYATDQITKYDLLSDSSGQWLDAGVDVVESLESTIMQLVR